MIRVVVADDNPVIRRGLVSLLESSGEVTVVAEASTGREAIAAATEHRPDVALVDYRMPGTDGITATETLHQLTRVLMLTYDDTPETVTQAIRSGASGFLIHGRFQCEELICAVRDVAAGRPALSPGAMLVALEALRAEGQQREKVAGVSLPGVSPLSERELDVMNLVAQGRTNSAIAGELFVNEKTVKNHINRIYVKLGVRTRAEAIALWLGVGRPGRERRLTGTEH